GAWFVDMTMTKSFPIGHYRLEARVEAYNARNHLIGGQPDTTFGGGNFGKVTRKRVDGYGRESQIGLRFAVCGRVPRPAPRSRPRRAAGRASHARPRRRAGRDGAAAVALRR